ncbi:nucleotide exchange factor GrpE [uncultured Sphingomonas sp.]|uniref:nucleotide exchange factor GrpE n=1 Tax=uncultured Sphingomonas sp. TaxID=158754 RepID=UPI0025E54338|nr:nucleotide exchange factor GrpE [uncultured Sphingomonas sp.]
MNNDTTASEDLRDETAAEAPEVAEHDAAEGLKAELEDLRKQLLYTQAETQNVRRRMEKDAADARAYAATGFARDMLSVADNLTRALAAIPPAMREEEGTKALVTGLEMTAKELDNVFQRNGITRIDSLGAKLDPNKHQAMIELPSDQEPGTIVQEMQAGYMIKERLLRPALVGVAKAGETPGVNASA